VGVNSKNKECDLNGNCSTRTLEVFTLLVMTIAFEIPKPMDAHVHFREGAMLQTVVPHTARQFSRATVMPNLADPVVTLERAASYHQEIVKAAGVEAFEAFMTLYLTPSLEQELQNWIPDHVVKAVKMYPKGATTNSDAGVSELEDIYGVLEIMEAKDIPLLIHGEVSDRDVDVFDRERYWVDGGLKQIVKKFPALRVVCEHITTKEMVDFVREGGEKIGATITPQHLLHDRNVMLGENIRPHWYCKPILKRKEDRDALLDLVYDDIGRVFAGTDSAPHTQENKETDCGCAGVYSAFCAMELYLTALSERLDLSTDAGQEIVRNFLSKNGPEFYGVSPSTEILTIQYLFLLWLEKLWYGMFHDFLIDLFVI